MENMEKLNSKNILVTGGAGFIGSHLVDKLIEQGNEVLVIDNLSSGKKENINPKAEFHKIDIRDPEISRFIKKIQIVFHLAAQPIVDIAYNNPLETIEINIMGTANLLESCRKNNNLKSIIITSSDKAYGKSKNLPYKETDPLLGDHPYNFSKSATDLLGQTYFKTYNLPIAITRFSNVFGPRDFNFSRIIPDIFKSIIKNEQLFIRSNGEMIREFTYVDDITNGCLKLADNIDRIKGQAFNFGSKNIFNIINLIKQIEEILNVKVDYKIINTAKNEIAKQYLDYSKAENLLDWHPKTEFKQAIKQTFNWYKEKSAQI